MREAWRPRVSSGSHELPEGRDRREIVRAAAMASARAAAAPRLVKTDGNAAAAPSAARVDATISSRHGNWRNSASGACCQSGRLNGKSRGRQGLRAGRAVASPRAGCQALPSRLLGVALSTRPAASSAVAGERITATHEAVCSTWSCSYGIGRRARVLEEEVLVDAHAADRRHARSGRSDARTPPAAI